MEIPIDGPDLKARGRVHPGETVDVPVKIRASGNAGRQELYLLFRYELLDDEESSVPTMHRWLRKMFEVPVYPSLSFSTALVPSYLTQGEHVLSVEFANHRNDRPDKFSIVLDRLSLASRSYRLEPLTSHVLLSGRDSDEDKLLQLGWQERVTMHFRVVPMDEHSETCLLSECLLSGDGEDRLASVESSSSPLLTFPCVERAHDQFEETMKSHLRAAARAAAARDQDDQHPRSIADIRRANTSASGPLKDGEGGKIRAVHPTSIARLCPPDTSVEFVSVFCSWRSEDYTIEGEHHVRHMSVRPAIKSAGCPITVTATHPEEVTNDFRDGPASVPLEVRLRNQLVRAGVDFEFTVERPENFDFTGPAQFRSKLNGGEEITVPMKAHIPCSGVYDLQKVRLTVHSEDSVAYHFPLQWMVTVIEA